MFNADMQRIILSVSPRYVQSVLVNAQVHLLWDTEVPVRRTCEE